MVFASHQFSVKIDSDHQRINLLIACKRKFNIYSRHHGVWSKKLWFGNMKNNSGSAERRMSKALHQNWGKKENHYFNLQRGGDMERTRGMSVVGCRPELLR